MSFTNFPVDPSISTAYEVYSTHTHAFSFDAPPSDLYQQRANKSETIFPAALRKGYLPPLPQRPIQPEDQPIDRSHGERRSPSTSSGMEDPPRPRRSRKQKRAYVPRHVRQAQSRAPSLPSDEEDELTEEPPAPNATEQDKSEYKRRLNTLAARRSRKRKMDHTQNLEEMVDKLTLDKEVWKTRAITLQQLLQNHGVACPEFPE